MLAFTLIWQKSQADKRLFVITVERKLGENFVHANAPPKERPPSDQRTLFGKRSLDESGEGFKKVRVEPTVEADTDGRTVSVIGKLSVMG